jgi:multicomponent K+:H+ antiporter subunit E
MSTWLPFPLLSACLMATWLLLNQTVSVGHVLLGAILALAGGWLLVKLQPDVSRIRNSRAMIRLAFIVLIDIVRSNIAVSRIILGPRHQALTSGFLTVPLDLRNRYGLAILACIITATPGTLWVRFDAANGLLMVHVLDLIDESTWIKTIKGRYERLLLEIFE